MSQGWGYINKKGLLIIPCKNAHACDFADGHSVIIESYHSHIRKYNIINTKGIMCKYYISNQFSLSKRSDHNYDNFYFSEGMMLVNGQIVENNLNHGGLIHYVGRSGIAKVVEQKKFSTLRDYSDGLAAVCQNGKWGYIDVREDIAIPTVYENAGNFSEGLALVKFPRSYANAYKSTYISKRNNIVLQHNFVLSGEFKNGLAYTCSGYEYDSRYGYIDKNNKLVIPFRFTKAYSFSEGLARVINEKEEWGFIDLIGNLVIPFKYKVHSRSAIKYFGDDGTERTSVSDKTRYLDDALDFMNGLARVSFDRKEFYIDQSGSEYCED